MGRLVRSFDLAVELYGSGAELLQSTSLAELDCLITDVQMPGMSGFALHDALRARHVEMPVIFMSAFADEDYEQRVRALGGVCFLHKPFEDTEIIGCIEQALRAQGPGLGA